MSRFWYVFQRFGGAPSYRHPTYDSAIREAQRLIDEHGGEYEILECSTVVKSAPKYVVEKLPIAPLSTYDDSNIPF